MANNNQFSVYSLTDVKVTFDSGYTGKKILNTDLKGKKDLSKLGGGRITISYAGDIAQNTKSATGYVVINKMVSNDGSIGLEIPQNSDADFILRAWVEYCKTCSTSAFAKASLTLSDPASGLKFVMTGVVPQKSPDESYDQQSGNRQYQLLFARMTVTRT